MALNKNGVEPTEIKFIDSSGQTHTPNIYTYATTGADLKEATRGAVSSYTSTQLNGWVGKENDTWSGITNVSQLEANKYYYIRVYVTDTQKYGKFCVMFKSVSGTTITVDNKGWGYDGEVIYSTPVWGKPYSLVLNGSDCEVLAYRNTSPNQHAGLGTLTGGGTVYYGDTVQISITPKTLAQYELTSVKINNTEQLSSHADYFAKTITVTSNIRVVATGGRKSSKTKFTAPEINGWAELVNYRAYQCTLNIYNNNDVTCTADITGYKNGRQQSGYRYVDVAPGESRQVKLSYTYSDDTAGGYRVEVYFQEDSNHYASDTEALEFNGYTDEVESSTTTTTE